MVVKYRAKFYQYLCTYTHKTDRILTRSVLFYQEEEGPQKDGMLGKKKGDEDLKGASDVTNDAKSFDTNNVKLYIEDVTCLSSAYQTTNLISARFERIFASWINPKRRFHEQIRGFCGFYFRDFSRF